MGMAQEECQGLCVSDVKGTRLACLPLFNRFSGTEHDGDRHKEIVKFTPYISIIFTTLQRFLTFHV
jgi:hypothetical protein